MAEPKKSNPVADFFASLKPETPVEKIMRRKKIKKPVQSDANVGFVGSKQK